MSPLSQDRFDLLSETISYLETVKEANTDKVWARITDKLAAGMGCTSAIYFSYQANLEKLTSRYELGLGPNNSEPIQIAEGEGLHGWVCRFREPLLIDEASADPRYNAQIDEKVIKATRVLSLPLFDSADITGVISLFDKRDGPFEKADLLLAQTACRVAALTLRALKLESTVDKVTAHNASILENLGGGFIAIDIHGRLMLCNPAAKKILELSNNIPLGQPIDHSLMSIPKMAEILLDTLVKKETVKRQEMVWSKSGKNRVLGYSTLMIQDPKGQVVGAGITFQDITQFQKK